MPKSTGTMRNKRPGGLPIN